LIHKGSTRDQVTKVRLIKQDIEDPMYTG